ncbi:MAG: sodium:calcium antiporter [Rhodothermaceae bacterium]
MHLGIHFLIIVACIFGLWGGAVLVVESASKIAKRMGLSELVIGLTVVAIATSAPEFAVTVVAAMNGENAISVGNIVGSNIFNLGIILGLVVLFTTIKTDKKIVYRDGSLLLGAGLLLFLFFFDGTLELYEGIILLCVLSGYMIKLFMSREPLEEDLPEGKFKWYDPFILIGGVLTIVGSAKFFVESASDVARHYGLSDWFIGLTIVAAGTSAPELATSLVAVIKGKHGISAGNLIGSDLFNMLGVLGVASIFHPLQIQEMEFWGLSLLPLTLMITIILLRTGWKLTRLEGIVLIAIALFRWSFEFILKSA